MKNIAILIPSLKPGGAEKQATLLAKVLDKHCNVDLYLLHGEVDASPANLKILEESNVRLHVLTGNMLSKLLQLKSFLCRNKTDILLNYLTSCDVVGAVIGMWVGVTRVYGGIRNERLEWWKIIMERFTHNSVSTGTIYNCYSGEEYFTSKGFVKKKNVVIPNCFPNISEPITRKEREIKHIVTVGRFVPQKDYKTMIRTIACLRKLRNDFVLDIVGYGDEESAIRGWVEEFGVADVVNININPKNVQDIVRASDIYLSTSLFEGTSNSIMEALNWSLPVVATNVGDNNHLIKEGENGYLHDIADAESMAESLSILLQSAELRNEFGRNSNKNLRDNYSMEIFEKRYLDLINIV